MRFLIATMVVSALSVSQARADQPLHDLLACRGTPDPAARLECFDRASDAALTAKQPDVTPPPAKPPLVESSIVRITQPSGHADITLENGQVWREMDADTAKSAKVGDRVIVSKAFLGAYWLKIKGGHAWRVTLVR